MDVQQSFIYKKLVQYMEFYQETLHARDYTYLDRVPDSVILFLVFRSRVLQFPKVLA